MDRLPDCLDMDITMKKFIVEDYHGSKFLRSPEYNYSFNKESGLFMRWGKDIKDDPLYSPFGPEILDIEITTKCNGIKGKLCSYCYKSNTPDGENMSFNNFKIIIDKINKNNQLTQIAFGLGSTGEENPDLWEMCNWLREERGIIPNGTVADIWDDTADKISIWFGACAVSYHGDKDICYDSIKRLTDRGMEQVNIHFVIHDSNYKEALSVIDDMHNDPRLKDMNAIVFLSLKQKGRAVNNSFMPLKQSLFEDLCKYALDKNTKIGFDSCSSPKFLKFIDSNPEYKQFEQYIEPCESFGIFSAYVNVDGNYFPCSFSEDMKEWEGGLSVLEHDDFIKDIWNGEFLSKYRDLSLKKNRECLFYKI